MFSFTDKLMRKGLPHKNLKTVMRLGKAAFLTICLIGHVYVFLHMLHWLALSLELIVIVLSKQFAQHVELP